MEHRIRAAVIIVHNDSILLVKHVHPENGFEWWVPPGGGYEEKDDSLFACAEREVREETGLYVKPTNIQYIREFFDTEYNALNIEFFMVVNDHEGVLSLHNIAGNGPDEDFITEVRWMSKDDLQNTVVYPEILKDKFWIDRQKGCTQTQYLGRQN